MNLCKNAIFCFKREEKKTLVISTRRPSEHEEHFIFIKQADLVLLRYVHFYVLYEFIFLFGLIYLLVVLWVAWQRQVVHMHGTFLRVRWLAMRDLSDRN